MTESRPQVCGESGSWGAELALGLLSGPDRAAALSHLAGCPTCRTEVDELAGIADRLLLLAPDAEPAAGFETRVLAAIGTAAVGSVAGAAMAGVVGPDVVGDGRSTAVGGGVVGDGRSTAVGPGRATGAAGGSAAVGAGGVPGAAGGSAGGGGRSDRPGGGRGGRLVALVAAMVAVAAIGGGVAATALRSSTGREATVLRTGLAVSASGRTSCRVVVSGTRPASVLVSMDGYPGNESEFMVEMETFAGLTVPLGPMAVAEGHGLLVRTVDSEAGAFRLMRMLDRDGRVVYEATLTSVP